MVDSVFPALLFCMYFQIEETLENKRKNALKRTIFFNYYLRSHEMEAVKKKYTYSVMGEISRAVSSFSWREGGTSGFPEFVIFQRHAKLHCQL